MSKNFKNLDIFYLYETIQKPWGGANTFLNYLYKSIEKKKGIKLIPINDFKEDKKGLFFFNQLGTGPKNKSRKFNKEKKFLEIILKLISSIIELKKQHQNTTMFLRIICSFYVKYIYNYFPEI